ncbi:CvfB family protein [Cytobacillus sp. FSL K6-0265]|uniref:CvfB family protein n=1 Tax=Cytobacillus sp. FSL K6-0265 TaxID=2921448 RepID=UPI0030FA2A76
MALIDEIGKTTELLVSREAAFGYFLTDGEEDVLLHKNEVKGEITEGQTISVFIYVDSEGRKTATMTLPEVTVGVYGWAKVVDVNPELGVFIDIGISKDMLLGKEDLPVHERVWPTVDDTLYVTLRVNRNGRIYVKLATDQVIASISHKAGREELNKDIHGFIYRTAKVGSWIYTADGLKGFIHETERRQEPRLGEKVNGRIIDVKQDGSINVSLNPRKQEALLDDSEIILNYLQSRNGAMPYSDKSAPEDIKDRFQLSKASFKRALGRLMKDGKIYQKEGWTYIKENESK